ncbi:MAG: hypothetical protein ACTSRP_01800 [Candidatus Helarchaeota archaeon]
MKIDAILVKKDGEREEIQLEIFKIEKEGAFPINIYMEKHPDIEISDVIYADILLQDIRLEISGEVINIEPRKSNKKWYSLEGGIWIDFRR